MLHSTHPAPHPKRVRVLWGACVCVFVLCVAYVVVVANDAADVFVCVMCVVG